MARDQRTGLTPGAPPSQRGRDMNTPAEHLNRMRDRAPLVQNITNYVAMNVMANIMLAAGASPAMVHASEEGPEFAAIASAVSINIGTIDADWAEAMAATAEGAQKAGTPWVLDPVAVGATAFRQEQGARLLGFKPTVIRGNASEILALGGTAAAGRGADAADPVAAAEEVARDLAKRTGAVVAVTGEVDYVTDGERAARVSNGHSLMPLVTALGCSLTGYVAAFIVDEDPFDATVAALACFAVAGEIAADGATGPGSFQVRFIDALHNLTADVVAERARVSAA